MVKLSRFAKIRENRESFPLRMFRRIRYLQIFSSYYVGLFVKYFYLSTVY